MAPGQAMESASVTIERNVIGAGLSLGALGIYTHSQSYKAITLLAIKAVSRAIWPVSLQEARTAGSTFIKTRLAWRPLVVMLTVVALLNVAVGREVIAVLTHGKFDLAAKFVTCWMIYQIIQCTCREYHTVLYTAGRGIFLTYVNVISQAVFLGSAGAIDRALGDLGSGGRSDRADHFA